MLNKQLERAASQAEEECQAILAAPGASRPASAAATPEASHASEGPRKQPRTAKPSIEEDQPMGQVGMAQFGAAQGVLPDQRRSTGALKLTLLHYWSSVREFVRI